MFWLPAFYRFLDLNPRLLSFLAFPRLLGRTPMLTYGANGWCQAFDCSAEYVQLRCRSKDGIQVSSLTFPRV